jgi:pSer/pThr/pTyr-binding forkhead associated (FHA) protein
MKIVYGDKTYGIRNGMKIGRWPNNDIVTPREDGSVSRRHVEFTVDGADTFVVDCNSTNGTFVNERRVVKRTRLEAGDTIRLGPNLTMLVAE